MVLRLGRVGMCLNCLWIDDFGFFVDVVITLVGVGVCLDCVRLFVCWLFVV